MGRLKVRRLVAAALSVRAGGLSLAGAGQAAGAATGGAVCIAHHPNYSSEYPIWYAAGCTGHDEPELDPVSSLPGSAKDLTWTAVLPKDGAVPVSSVGPTFWWGGTVTDPNPHSLFNQAFLELQFYPDAIVKSCSADGGFNVVRAPNKYSVGSPTWQVDSVSKKENAAFNAELFDGSSNRPLVMNAGDTIRIHFFVVSPSVGWYIHVTDLSTGHDGTIVLNSKYGPLLPAFDKQQIGNALGWGLVNDTPNSFVWEIGHTSPFTSPAGAFCLPGQTQCDSYDEAHSLGFTPLRITPVSFPDGSRAKQWAVVSDFGGTAEINQNCTSYGGPFCVYPWFAFNGTASALTYGADYPGTTFAYGKANHFPTTTQYAGPFGANSTYCDTAIKPVPLAG